MLIRIVNVFRSPLYTSYDATVEAAPDPLIKEREGRKERAGKGREGKWRRGEVRGWEEKEG
jgi:hypothetical protein